MPSATNACAVLDSYTEIAIEAHFQELVIQCQLANSTSVTACEEEDSTGPSGS